MSAPSNTVAQLTARWGPRIFVLEGLPGSGKTSLIYALATELRRRGVRVCCIFEPVSEWERSGLLQAFYQDASRWAYALQTLIVQSMSQHVEACVAQQPDADVYLLERTPATGRVFMNTLLRSSTISMTEVALYESWGPIWLQLSRWLWRNWNHIQPIYLRTSAAEAFRRVLERARPAEGTINVDYLQQLRNSHDEALLPGAIVGESLYPNQAIVVDEGLADSDWRAPGSTLVRDLLAKMGF